MGENQERMEEKMEVQESTQLMVQDFSQMTKGRNLKSERKIFTNINDQKKIFNLETNVDQKLNDCKGEKIRVVGVLIKIIEKQLNEPEVNEETGEIIKDKETKMITILIDDNDTSYVTASKMFTIQMMNYIQMFGMDAFDKGLEIEITERSIKNSNNKALGFELL